MAGDAIGHRLSPGQRHLWRQTGAAERRCQLAVEVRGPLKLPALRTALRAAAQRHDSLRTVFAPVPGMTLPIQVIGEVGPSLLPDGVAPHQLDRPMGLDGPAQLDGPAALERLAARERRRPMQLDAGPLLRAALARASTDRHILLLTASPLVADVDSLALLAGDCAQRYDGCLVAGADPGTAEPSLQYSQYAAWQNELVSTADEPARQYWRERAIALAAAPLLPLEQDGTPALHPTVQQSAISAETLDGLARLATLHGVAVSQLLLAAWLALLARLAEGAAPLLGMSWHARDHEELSDAAGLFARTVPVTAGVEVGGNLSDVVRAVQRELDDSRPFWDAFVLDDSVSWQDGGEPFFRYGFAARTRRPPWSCATLDFLEVGHWDHAERSAIRLQLSTSGGAQSAPALRWEYDANCFDGPAVARMDERLGTFLQRALAQPSSSLATLIGPGPREHAEILRHSAPDGAATGDPLTPVDTRFWACVDAHPTSTAARDGKTAMSYAELAEQVMQLAMTLRKRGVGPDRVVALAYPPSVDLLVGMLGTWQAGGAFLCLEPDTPQERLASIIEAARPVVVLSNEDTTAQPATTQQPITKRSALPQSTTPQSITAQSITAQPITPQSITRRQRQQHRARQQQLAYVTFTSGSSGKPKGVAVTHGALANYIAAASDMLSLPPGAQYAVMSTLAADLAYTTVFTSLVSGGCLHFFRKQEALDFDALANHLRQHPIDCMKLVPSHLAALLAAPEPGALLPRRWLVTGGEALTWQWAERVHQLAPACRILNHYGPAEATIGALAGVVNIEARPALARHPPLGRPLCNVGVYLVDERFALVPIGSAGEVMIAGAGLARGYLADPAQTAARYVPVPRWLGLPGARWYRTGDRARLLPGGEMEFLGRTDRQIKIRGFRVEPQEIEAVLRQHDRVLNAAVVCRQDGPTGQPQLAAYLVPQLPAQSDAVTGSPAAGMLDQWQMVFDDLYGYGAVAAGSVAGEAEDPTFDITGWNSSYTGEQMDPREIREQIDHTVSNVLAAPASQPPLRVLEVGCGNGLLLFQLAGSCRRYVATDFSANALDRVRRGMARARPQAGGMEGVELLCRRAHDFTELREQAFDVVLLNSVIQYFHGPGYLDAVLRAAAARVAPGGALYVGDVRHLALQTAYHLSIALVADSDEISAATLARRIAASTDREEELVVAPDYFYQLAASLDRSARVEIGLKRGVFANELTRFRYDAILRFDDAKDVPAIDPQQLLRWGEQRDPLAQLATRLNDERPAAMGLVGVPNSRLQRERHALRWLDQADPTATLAELRAELAEIDAVGLDPEQVFRTLAPPCHEHGYELLVDWSRDHGPMCFDVLVQRPGTQGGARTQPAPRSFAAPLTNQPLAAHVASMLAGEVRTWLADQLPDYLVPASLTVLRRLPLTDNGKLDMQALPAPDDDRQTLDTEYKAPRTPVEEQVAEVWFALLGLKRVGIDDDFFALGGHSLLATQVIHRLRRSFELEVPLRLLFDAPTVSGVALGIVEMQLAEFDDLDEDGTAGSEP